jgi:hypothetical protein
MTTEDKIDWAQCPLIDVNSDVQGAVPVLRGTQVPAKVVVDGFVQGMAVPFTSDPGAAPTLAFCLDNRFYQE